MKVVIVESPSKAKTINKYLGSDYKVLASFGHVRDLPAKDGSVDPTHNFAMQWEFTPTATKHINEIVKSLKNADTLYLATDPDREGEAISWHVKEVLSSQKDLSSLQIKRVLFYEVTKSAILDALKNPRDLNADLVDAYLARRALDYLVGFNLSPVLWHKLPGSRSAGRVQSVALRLVAEREGDIETFHREEFWTIHGHFTAPENKEITAKLITYQGKKVEKFSFRSQEQADQAVHDIQKEPFTVVEITKKQVKRNPVAPFITSTLQQEASRKLGFSARKTMQVAQKLYEGVDVGGELIGLITYMRTDSVNLSQEALKTIRSYIETSFGKDYLPDAPRQYKSTAKNAQEAHEAIRPTFIARTPASLKNGLDHDLFKLYELIWKRAVASQMTSAILDQVSIDFGNQPQTNILRVTGSTLAFDGFLKLYVESQDEEEKDKDDESLLPPAFKGESWAITSVVPEQHFTQPPPRFTEASLVKKLEELGIGRPSTYASIMSTLVERKYVNIEKKQLIPNPLGRFVTTFLKSYFKRYVEYDFTADLEQKLDDISEGNMKRETILNDFWTNFSSNIQQTKELKITDVIDRLNLELATFLFKGYEKKEDGYECPQCKTGHLSLKLGKFGAFIGCSGYPSCTYTHQLSKNGEESSDEISPPKSDFPPRLLGKDPSSSTDVVLKKGPYGFYLEWALLEQAKASKKAKPKRVSLPPNINPDVLTLEEALTLGSLPRTLGSHPETKESVSVGVGRYGPYIKYQEKFTSLGKNHSPYTVTLEEALSILAIAAEKKKSDPSKPSKKN